MKRTTILILAATLAIPMLSVSTAQAQPTMADRASAYRLGAFRMIGWHLGPIGAMAKGEKPFDADAVKLNADAIAALSQFPKNGSSMAQAVPTSRLAPCPQSGKSATNSTK